MSQYPILKSQLIDTVTEILNEDNRMKMAVIYLIDATKELADLYECSYGRGDDHCHNEAWGVDHLTSCPKLVAEKAIERVRKWL